MQGSHPQRGLAHYATNPQHLADGGQVGFGARGLSGLRDLIPKMAAMGYPQAAPAPAPTVAAAPATDPRAAQLQAMIPRMEAMGYKQQRPQYLAKGGLVHGPGTGTSDSIETEAEPGTFIMPADSTAEIGPSALKKMGTVPVRLSNGEFEVPPEQVMAIGVAVLKAMKDATHTPVNGVDGGQTDAEVAEARGFAPGAEERMAQVPEQLFADGGLIENDVTRVGNSYSGGNVGGAITVNGSAPAGTFSENPGARLAAPPAPRPATTTAVSMIRATPPVPATTPSASPVATPPAAAPMGWQARQDQRNLEVTASSIMDSPERRAAQQRLGTMPAAGFEPRRFADGGVVEDDLQKRLAQIPSSAPPGWTGGGQATATAPVPAAPAAAPPAPVGALSRAASYVAPTPVPATSLAAQAMSTSAQPRPLNDQPVTQLNMDAAQGVASRGAAEALAAMPNAPAPVQAPTIRHSGNDWAARNALRNAEVSASSIMNNGGKWDQTGGRNPAALAYRAALDTDNALQATEPAIGLAAMKDASETNRAAMRERGLAAQALASERGAMDRTLVTERGNNTRAGITALAGLEEARLKAGASGQKLTEDQAKSAGYALRMDNALKLINEIGAKNPGATRPGVGTSIINSLPEGVANFIRPEDRQRVEAAQLDALDAALTLNTGAAYTREQLQGLSRSYFPQPGDDPKTIAEKQARLASQVETARLRAGPSGSAMADAAQAKGAQAAAGQTSKAPAMDALPTQGIAVGRRIRDNQTGQVLTWDGSQWKGA